MFRFSVRQAPLPGRYGVWDAHANDWYGDWTLTEPEANRQVHDLDVRYDFYTERKPSDVRPLPEPRPVVLYGWQPAGELDVWVRDDGSGGAGSATTRPACTSGTPPTNCNRPPAIITRHSGAEPPSGQLPRDCAPYGGR